MLLCYEFISGVFAYSQHLLNLEPFVLINAKHTEFMKHLAHYGHTSFIFKHENYI